MDTETALFYGFIFLLLLVISTVILLLIHSGFFAEINVQTCKPCIGEMRIAYKFARGPYKDSGSLFTEVHTLLPQYRTIGVYYDDPKKKEQSRLRYIVGLILSENGEPVKEEDEKILKDWDYSFVTFPSINHAVQTSFPFKSTLSIIVGIFRVYPILDEYIEVRSLCVHPFIEVYDNENGKIFFIGPLEQQDSFYVPEVLEAEEKSNEEEEEDDHSSVSFDESASYLKNDDGDSDEGHSASTAEHSLLLDADKLMSDGLQEVQAAQSEAGAQAKESTKPEVPEVVGKRSSGEEDSDNNTASSFEEIDDKEAPEIKDEAVDKTEL